MHMIHNVQILPVLQQGRLQMTCSWSISQPRWCLSAVSAHLWFQSQALIHDWGRLGAVPKCRQLLAKLPQAAFQSDELLRQQGQGLQPPPRLELLIGIQHSPSLRHQSA